MNCQCFEIVQLKGTKRKNLVAVQVNLNLQEATVQVKLEKAAFKNVYDQWLSESDFEWNPTQLTHNSFSLSTPNHKLINLFIYKCLLNKTKPTLYLACRFRNSIVVLLLTYRISLMNGVDVVSTSYVMQVLISYFFKKGKIFSTFK